MESAGVCAAAGAIVLLHDGDEFNPPGSARLVVEALGAIVEGIAERGLATVPVGELVVA